MSLIIVHSPKGGVGCTTLAANIAAWLSRSGREVLAADFATHDNLSLHFGREAEAGEGRRGVQLLDRSGSLSAEALLDEIERVLDAQGEPRDNGPALIVDVPAGAPALAERLARRATIRLCVLAADAASAAMLPVILEHPPQAGEAPFHFVLNGLDERRSVGLGFQRLLRETVGDDLVGTIRRDEAVNEALAALSPLFDHAPASAAAADIATLANRIAASIDDVRAPRRAAVEA
ncbi:MAG: AAA family ATPase [Sphingomonas fennica]